MKVVEPRLAEIEKAYLEKDFATFGKITMQDSNQFHATCLDTYPPIFYMNDISRLGRQAELLLLLLPLRAGRGLTITGGGSFFGGAFVAPGAWPADIPPVPKHQHAVWISISLRITHTPMTS